MTPNAGVRSRLRDLTAGATSPDNRAAGRFGPPPSSVYREPMTVIFADIQAAQARITGQVDRTPVRHSRRLSQLTGAEVWVKYDNLHFTGSFKERGALNRLLQLTPDERGAAWSRPRPATTPRPWPITAAGWACR